MISSIHAALSAVQVFSKKIQVSANNIAHASTDGFKKTRVLAAEQPTQGVMASFQKVQTDGPKVIEETNDGKTTVEKSNIDFVEEITDTMLSQRMYEANLKTIKTIDEMLGKVVNIKK
jgi:flagellar basal-body rod protein FlgC